MTGKIYIKKPTQEDRILDLLTERGDRGAYVYEFMAPRPNGLGIAQYNARVYGLRSKGYNIINKTPGHFVLITNSQPKITFNEQGQGAFI